MLVDYKTIPNSINDHLLTLIEGYVLSSLLEKRKNTLTFSNKKRLIRDLGIRITLALYSAEVDKAKNLYTQNIEKYPEFTEELNTSVNKYLLKVIGE